MSITGIQWTPSSNGKSLTIEEQTPREMVIALEAMFYTLPVEIDDKAIDLLRGAYFATQNTAYHELIEAIRLHGTIRIEAY